jgi:hypothetical protein
VIKLSVLIAIVSILVAGPSCAADLEQIFSNVRSCQFDSFYYDEATRNPPHPYFTERSLKPYKEADGLYFFHVQDQLFDLPVIELVVPGTQDFHMVAFDVPLVRARTVVSTKFGTDFGVSEKSEAGEAPALISDPKNAHRSFLYCVEREAGL